MASREASLAPSIASNSNSNSTSDDDYYSANSPLSTTTTTDEDDQLVASTNIHFEQLRINSEQPQPSLPTITTKFTEKLDLTTLSPFPSTSNSTANSPSALLPSKHRTAVIFQQQCENHKFIRNQSGTVDLSIVERPERLRAVKTGVAAAFARLETRDVRKRGAARWTPQPVQTPGGGVAEEGTELEMMLKGLKLKDDGKGKGKAKEVIGGPFDLLQSEAMMPVDNPALLYIHPLPNEPPQSSSSEPPSTAPPPPPTLPPISSFNLPTTDAAKATGTQPSTSETPEPLADTAPNSSPSIFATSPPQLIPSSTYPITTTPNPIPATKAPDPTPPWPTQLQSLCRSSLSAIQDSPTHSEIPAHLPQGDLYLCPGSEGAIFGALGAVCEAVDRIVDGATSDKEGGYDRAFVAIRPPGHHCCENQPMGFCFVNNVAVAAAHAHQKHGIDRVIIVDIDLHHGNGTQEIAWRINSEANAAIAKSRAASSPRKGSPAKNKKPQQKERQLQIMYASLHDIFSYPCEDGDPALVQAASLNISGGHSQYIANVHLEPWDHETEFHEKLYHKYRDRLLGPAAEFCVKTAIEEDESAKTLVILSAGFDASEHEGRGMSRHLRNVPVSFYHRWARDMCKFANQYAQGKVLAVLEGGYSDRALASGTLATLVGLVEAPRVGEKTFVLEEGDERTWWDERSLGKLERACKVGRGGKLSGSVNPGVSVTGEDGGDGWVRRATEIFAMIDPGSEVGERRDVVNKEQQQAGLGVGGLGRTMQLRERRTRMGLDDSTTPTGSPSRTATTARVASASRKQATKTNTPLPPAPPLPIPTTLPLAVFTTPLAVAGSELSAPPQTDAPPTSDSAPVAQPKIKFTWREGGIGVPRP
ncbi:Arginase/deacetylase [Meredithblackwellia eburnea MCA 4105]